ncbi:MAG: TetR/AcrR family transcriptional regulator [Halioglobus sp.]
MTREMGAREAHSLKIRSALVTACSDLLAKHHIDAITINQIVETAGVAKGSFYNHFPDKETLATTVSDAIREKIEYQVQESTHNITDPAYKVARGVCNHVKLAVEDPRRAIIMLRNPGSTTSSEFSLNRNIHAHVSEGVESTRFDARCKNVGMLQIIGITFMIMTRIIEDKLATKESITLTTEALTLIFCGFGVPEEEARRIASESAEDIIGASCTK